MYSLFSVAEVLHFLEHLLEEHFKSIESIKKHLVFAIWVVAIKAQKVLFSKLLVNRWQVMA